MTNCWYGSGLDSCTPTRIHVDDLANQYVLKGFAVRLRLDANQKRPASRHQSLFSTKAPGNSPKKWFSLVPGAQGTAGVGDTTAATVLVRETRW